MSNLLYALIIEALRKVLSVLSVGIITFSHVHQPFIPYMTQEQKQLKLLGQDKLINGAINNVKVGKLCKTFSILNSYSIKVVKEKL